MKNAVTLAAIAVLGAMGPGALFASAASTTPGAPVAADQQKQITPAELDNELKAQGKAFQPFKNPKEFKSKDGVLKATLKVDAHRFEGPGFAFNTRLYNGQYPGPTLRFRAGDKVHLKLVNKMGANIDEDTFVMNQYNRPNTTNMHLHGMHVSPLSPQDDVLAPIGPGESFEYVYDIMKEHNAGSNWYHPHNHGSVTVQLNGGMAGIIVVEDDPETTDPALLAMDDVIAVVQQVNLMPHKTQSLYAMSSNNGTSTLPLDVDNPYNISFNMLLVSGQYKPVVALQPGELKRVRLVNALVTKNLYFGLPEEMRDACSLTLLGYDGVYLSEPRPQDDIFISSGKRADFTVQCTKKGKFVISTLWSDKEYYKTHFDSWAPIGNWEPEDLQEMIILDVKGEKKDMKLPKKLPALPYYLSDLTGASEDEITDRWAVAYGSSTPGFMALNGQLFDHAKPGHTVKLGAVSEWNITSVDTTRLPGIDFLLLGHPHHQHVNHYQIMNDDAVTGGLIFKKGDWHDTIEVWEDANALIRFHVADFVGPMVVHCHILQHEDQGMMTYVDVTADGQGSSGGHSM